MSTIEQIILEVDSLHEQLKTIHFSKSYISKLKEQSVLDWTYNSNAIEGNTLTLRETQLVLEGVTVGGKSLYEHLEVINHSIAIDELEKNIYNRESLSESFIKRVHSLVLRTIDDANAGCYRRENVRITGASFIPPAAFKIPQRMSELIAWHEGSHDKTHPILLASALHTRFVRIHPFVDGNGRTARLLLNFELLKNGYPPAIVKFENRKRYYEALELADTQDDHTAFAEIVCESLRTQIAEQILATPDWEQAALETEDDSGPCF